MEELGRALKSAREEKGITLDEISRETKISRRHLEAIEAGAFDQLPGAVYARAFLRHYAKAIGLDPEYVIAQYREHQGLAAPASVEVETGPGLSVARYRERRRRRRARRARVFYWIAVLLLAAAAIAAVVYIAGGRRPPELVEEHGGLARAPLPPGPASVSGQTTAEEAIGLSEASVPGDAFVPGEGSAAAGAFELNGFSMESGALNGTDPGDLPLDALDNERPALVPPPVAQTPLAVGAENQGGLLASAPWDERGEGGGSADAIPGDESGETAVGFLAAGQGTGDLAQAPAEVVLRVEVVETCWVDVSADGERIFTGVLQPGTIVTWVAQDLLQVRFGRPEGVFLTLNGVPLGRAGTGVITREFRRDGAD